jgi:hypothetical protein
VPGRGATDGGEQGRESGRCLCHGLRLWSCDSGMWRGLRLGSGPAEGEGDAGPANDQGRARERRKGLQLHYHG